MITRKSHFIIPLGAGLIGSVLLTSLYLGLVSWAESFQHAIEFFWQDRWIIFPIVLGFGIQVGLFVVLKKRLFLSAASTNPSGMMTGASGATSTIAMAACCAHHVTDALPILGLTAAAALLAEYRTTFMLFGLGMTLVGILAMLIILFKEKRKAVQLAALSSVAEV